MPNTDVLANQPSQKRVSRFFGQYIIKHRFQFKFSFMIFTFLAIAAFIIWVEGYVAVKSMVSSGMVAGEDAIAQLKLLNNIIGKTSVLTLAIAFGLSLFFSHFVAGPLYRFERVLEEMKNGNLAQQVRLRKHDEFKEIADLFNQTLASLRVKLKKERDGVDETLTKFKQIAETLKSQGRTTEAAELEQLIVEIKNTPPQIHI